MQLRYLLEQAILEESASVTDVTSAIENHNRVIINYHTRGGNDADGARVIEVYVYGLTKSGNPAIRAFQPYGDTTSKVPSWKIFRLDRIVEWRPTEQTFSRPASDYYKWVGDFNEKGDKSFSVIYMIASFGDSVINDEGLKNILQSKSPIMKEPYKTDTEKGMERLKQQLDHPIKLSDLKQKPSSGPKLKNNPPETEKEEELFKTDTERGMERLRQQLDNPQKIDLSKFSKEKPEEPNETNKEEEEEKEEIYKTETERGLERLRQQLNNPQKIDLDNIPKR